MLCRKIKFCLVLEVLFYKFSLYRTHVMDTFLHARSQK